jgi:hypothetical protein
MSHRIESIYYRSIDYLWILLWVGLPLTSFPIIGWMTKSQAAPFSAIPLGLLAAVWFIPQVLRGRQLPREVVPILFFALAGIVSSATVYFLDDALYFGSRTFWGQSLRALLTLSIGMAFYLLTTTWSHSEASLRRALQWIYIGGAVMLLWGLMQTVIIFTMDGHFPVFLEKIRMWLVIQYYAVREGDRVASLAYEPSWFAHQLNLLYLPLWLASTYLRKSVFKIRFFRLSVENILLVFGLVEFLLSRPRIGLAAFLLVLAFLFIKSNVNTVKRINHYLIDRYRLDKKSRKTGRILITLLISFAMITLYLVIAYLIVYVGSKFDARLALLFEPIPKAELEIIKALNEGTLLYIGSRLKFLERVIYWLSGWHIFSEYPIFGIGLGNAGFFVQSHVPQTGWMTSELRNLVYRLGYAVNTKSYWIRILTETGLVGFSLFITWLAGLWRSARFLLDNPNKTYRLIGLAGQLALVAFILEGFSLDSFALPYLWITAGLLSAARMAATNEKPQADDPP